MSLGVRGNAKGCILLCHWVYLPMPCAVELHKLACGQHTTHTSMRSKLCDYEYTSELCQIGCVAAKGILCLYIVALSVSIDSRKRFMTCAECAIWSKMLRIICNLRKQCAIWSKQLGIVRSLRYEWDIWFEYSLKQSIQACAKSAPSPRLRQLLGHCRS